MTIKDIASQAGISVQAVYKRIRASGLMVETMKDKETGQLTPEAEKAVESLFHLERKPVDNDSTQVEALTARVTELTTQVENLIAERDYLRKALDQAQQLQALTLAKIPAALPPGEKRPGFFGTLFKRGGKRNAE